MNMMKTGILYMKATVTGKKNGTVIPLMPQMDISLYLPMRKQRMVLNAVYFTIVVEI